MDEKEQEDEQTDEQIKGQQTEQENKNLSNYKQFSLRKLHKFVCILLIASISISLIEFVFDIDLSYMNFYVNLLIVPTVFIESLLLFMFTNIKGELQIKLFAEEMHIISEKPNNDIIQECKFYIINNIGAICEMYIVVDAFFEIIKFLLSHR